ncbi:MAG TPA: SusD/RagB family nutrient-binding outer membrane lipoprotein [Gemmatimonadaceae bacterium]|nr:SusD/RagB family nutrient-binding outer membrane lipoprotein [Gemmatimonadaceae bacterium]
MKSYIRTALVAATVVAAGCSNYLDCGECITSPTSPTQATSTQRIVATQAKLWQLTNGDLARETAMFMQQMAGVGNQYQVIDKYSLDAGGGGDFTTAYGGAGLIDLKRVEADSRASGDKTMVGIALVFKAWLMSVSADVWGDAPYTQAAQPDAFPTPVYDAQQVVYDSLQNALSDAITNLNANAGAGPSAAELVYKGDRAKWIALAHTLKARLYLHVAERDASAYAKALTEANLGISSSAGDYVTLQTSTAGEQNDWYQFQVVGQRTSYMRAGAFGVNLLTAANDPRLTELYQKATGSATIVGGTPGQSLTSAMGNVSAKRLADSYGQPLVTYNENLLIKAEALFKAGNLQAALDTLNKERASWATANPWRSAITLAPQAGPVTLEQIMNEKYIVLFQNIEAWNDYKRTCLPKLTPGNGAVAIPGRLLYPTSERQTNTANVPADPVRNWNDPQACTGA